MDSMYITGYALRQNGITNSNIRNAIEDKQSFPLDEDPDAFTQEVKKKLAREDRAIITELSLSSIAICCEAMAMAEQLKPFTDVEKENTFVMATAETEDDFYTIIYKYLQKHQKDGDEVTELKDKLGVLVKETPPLRLFRKLPTNSAYNISKFFGLRGGGYPLKKMSMGGHSLVEEVFYLLKSGPGKAGVLCAYGNLNNPDVLNTFRKMDLISTGKGHLDKSAGIRPTQGLVSLVVEKTISAHPPLAEVFYADSVFANTMFASESDWSCLYSRLVSRIEIKDPIVVMYDNGAPDIGEIEEAAIKRYFPQHAIRRYCPITGYAASTSGIINIIMALADPSIQSGKNIIINSVGAGVGCGLIVIKKH
ncbi:hypothetical protein [Rahnella aceris]|jgi:hypothetical protein